MQRFTVSLSAPFSRPAPALFSRLLRAFRGAPADERPAFPWAEMKPIDFDGEDTSLTQEQLAALR
jgi:hypothetical protein